MDVLTKNGIEERLPAPLGRRMWRALGDEAHLSDSVSCGFARFTLDRGAMIPHRHEREIILVLNAEGARARAGFDKATMGEGIELHEGQILRMAEDEWHVFDLDDESSFLEIYWFFSVPMNRLEE
ncbi:hypothetical protein CH267_13335 [Rhodococcus sp. 06-621-2]|nr:hypothetical protein [Rhodococcus sp. 06-621-2]OZC55547.1 hypothetical protein CH267_13335 [Rhodococcus sp. 06-621-2]